MATRNTPGGYASLEEHLAAIRARGREVLPSQTEGTGELVVYDPDTAAGEAQLQWQEYQRGVRRDAFEAEGARRVQLWNDYYAQTGDYTPVIQEPMQRAGDATGAEAYTQTAQQKERLRAAQSLQARRGRTRTVLSGGYQAPELSAPTTRPTLLGGGG
jgi:hypothetical protein